MFIPNNPLTITSVANSVNNDLARKFVYYYRVTQHEIFAFFAKITTKILPKKKLKPKATPIRPNVFALFSGLEISARIVVAVAAVPPLKPSISLAKNNKNNGIEAIEFDQLKRTVKDNIDIPTTEPVIQKRVTGLLPYLSLISPIKGEAVN